MGLKGIAAGQVSTGGTGATTAQGAAANLGAPYLIAKGGIPLIGLASGSVAANGAISLGANVLPRIYPSAYCYFPANILATTIAAGFYYCTFSSTSAGIAFLNTLPATGQATIPASPTAVTDGKGAFTGDTGEEFGVTFNIPALTATSAIRIAMEVEAAPNNANAKTQRVRLSGNAGTIFFVLPGTSQATASLTGSIINTGATGKQISSAVGNMNATSATYNVLGSVDTSVATTLVFSLQRATATDNFILFPPSVELLHDGT